MGIWIWLAIAIAGALLVTPADPIAIILAMAFALPCYLLGAVWASTMKSLSLWLATIACMLIGGVLSAGLWFPLSLYSAGEATAFITASFVLGFISCRFIIHGRRRIFSAVGISFALGLLLGPLGVIILTVPSAIVANRSVEKRIG